MVRIGGQPLGFGKSGLGAQNASFFYSKLCIFLPVLQQIRLLRVGAWLISLLFFVDECGIVAQISQPLAESDISAYYISTFSFDHALVSVYSIATLEVNRNHAAVNLRRRLSRFKQSVFRLKNFHPCSRLCRSQRRT